MCDCNWTGFYFIFFFHYSEWTRYHSDLVDWKSASFDKQDILLHEKGECAVVGFSVTVIDAVAGRVDVEWCGFVAGIGARDDLNSLQFTIWYRRRQIVERFVHVYIKIKQFFNRVITLCKAALEICFTWLYSCV